MQKTIFILTLLVLTTAFVGNTQNADDLVIVFTQNNCEPCENAVGLLESEGFQVDERNISQFKLYKKELLAKLKSIGWNNPKLPVMPVIETETKIYTTGEKAVSEIIGQGDSNNTTQTTNNNTSTPDPISVVTGGDTEPAEMKGIVARHNYWRAQLGLPGLVWSNKMALLAQDWANQLAKKGCEMQHRPSNKFGENIYWCSGFKATPQAVTDSWADERKDFNFTTLECNGEWYKCGHYTQLIWETTTSVGCGMATCGNQQIWVCNYDPPGNWTGQKPYKKK